MAISERADKIREILDAKYVAADLESVCSDQAHLNKDEQTGLLKLLRKHEDLFDGTLGRRTGDPVDIELKPDAEPHHARPCPAPKCHQDTLRNEVGRLVEIGVLKKVNHSEWGAPALLSGRRMGPCASITIFVC